MERVWDSVICWCRMSCSKKLTWWLSCLDLMKGIQQGASLFQSYVPFSTGWSNRQNDKFGFQENQIYDWSRSISKHRSYDIAFWDLCLKGKINWKGQHQGPPTVSVHRGNQTTTWAGNLEWLPDSINDEKYAEMAITSCLQFKASILCWVRRSNT